MTKMRKCVIDGCGRPHHGRGYCRAHHTRLLRGTSIHTPVQISDPRERFWSKVDKTEGCWLWTGARNRDGYGKLKLDGRMRAAHRLAFEMEKGPIPVGLEVDHMCHNRSCVNPDHLRAVTHAVNMKNRRAC